MNANEFTVNKIIIPIFSSVSRIEQSNNSASTSVSHEGSNVAQEDDEARRIEVLDRLRFKHIRQIMKDKKNNLDKDKK